jgi:hypothetical protein
VNITVCLIAHNRQRHLSVSLEELLKISDHNKQRIQVKVLNGEFYDKNLIDDLSKKFEAANIKFENILPCPAKYFDKCKMMADQDSEYIIKCDEDIYMSSDGWDHFLNGVNSVNWDYCGCYVPLITSGIPGIETFLDLYVDKPTRDYFREVFSLTKIPNMWGVDEYEKLTYDKDNSFKFFSDVSKIDHYYKGIHPLRVSSGLQSVLVDWLLINNNWKKPDVIMPLSKSSPVYFCNSIYLMPTRYYKEAVEGMRSNKYIFDGFDEVGMNEYIKDKDMLFITNLNSVAVHPSYNTIGLSYEKISQKFYENIR